IQEKGSAPWFWPCIALLVVVLIFGGLSSPLNTWLKNMQANSTSGKTPAAPITTMQVQRTAPYAGLDITVISAQYATYFTDDNIRPGPATVRLNIRVTNTNSDQARITYDDSDRLIVPHMQPIAPANSSFSSELQAGRSASGWLDFAVQNNVPLRALALQLGSTAMSESLVTIPFRGIFDGSHYASKTYPLHDLFTYDFSGHILMYHLTSVETRYAYQGSQCKVGQQFYVFNFAVDNTENSAVTPGFGFDYLRLVSNGYSQPPIDNTLPNTLKANAQGASGRVVFTGPADMRTFTIGFLSQNGNGQQKFSVNI
ncbi:MAG TPA: hypothetical protein VHZ51_13130, partial [Ktedonobacteraceae bacterium]|nr:hypothetical protein [Ktedonobacteraceae bacterium]